MPIAFDALGTGQTGAVSSWSFNHTATAGAYVIVDVSVDRAATLTNVQYGGLAMTFLGSVNYNNNATLGTISRYGIANVAGGTRAVTGTISTSVWLYVNSTSWTGVNSVGALSTVYGTGVSLSQGSVQCVTGQKIIQAFGQGNNGAALSALSGGTNRFNQYATFVGLTVNEASSTTTFSGTATGAVSGNWGGIATILNPKGTFQSFFKGYGPATTNNAYSDNFNRASLGTDWTNRLTPVTGINAEIENSNSLGVSTAFNYAFVQYYQDMPSDNVKVTITIGPDVVSSDYYLIGLRGNGTEVVYAYCQPANVPQIMTHPTAGGDWRNMINGGQTVRGQGPVSQTYVAGDTISFEARGNVYTIMRNEVVIAKWNDSGGVIWGANINSSHRQWGIGLGTVGSATRGIIDSVTAVAVGAVPTPPFSDDFSTSYTNIHQDANWQNWTSTAVRTISGRAEATSGGVWTVASYNWPMLTNHHKISATYVNPNVNFAGLLYVRGNNSHQIFGYIIDTGNATALFANTNVWASPGGTNYGQAVVDWADGDTASLEAIENAYIIRKNGVAQVIVFDLNGGVWGANVNSAHRDVGIGFLNNSGTATGWGSISAEDLVSNYFMPSRMIKNGTLAWATSATWVDITSWTPLNDATYTSLLATAAITVLTGKTGATLDVSVPFTGSTAGRQHTIRIMRTRTAAGAVDTTVVATGATVAATAGTCLASVTMNVQQGETYIVQMNSDGASAGTITATTPTFTIS